MPSKANNPVGKVSGKAKIASAVALAAIIWYLFSSHLALGFGDFDNNQWYGEVKGRDTLWKVFDYTLDTGYTPSTYYQPIQTLVWGFMVGEVGNEPYWYYLVCMAIHLANAILLFLLLAELTDNAPLSFAAAASFAVFYPNYQTLSWISASITHGVTALFFVSTILLYVKYSKTRSGVYYGLSVAAFALAVLTKEIAIFLIPVVLAYHVLLGRKGGLRCSTDDLRTLPYMLLAIPILYVSRVILSRSIVMSGWGGVNFGLHMSYRFMDYLSFMATAVPISEGMKMVLAGAVLLAAPLVAYHACRDRKLAFLVAWLAVSVSMFIYTNFRDIYSLGRYLYIPSMAWFSLLYYGASRVGDRVSRSWSYAALICYTLVLNVALILAG